MHISDSIFMSSRVIHTYTGIDNHIVFSVQYVMALATVRENVQI